MKYKIIFFMLVCALGLHGFANGSVYKIYTLPELIRESPHILLGIIRIDNQKPMISITKDFKGGLAGKYQIAVTPAPFLDQPEFSNDERVILFASEPTGETIQLTGMGSQAKWPKVKKESYYDDIYAEASLDEVAGLIDEVLALQKTRDLDAQVLKIQNLLAAPSRVAQVVALQTINGMKHSADKENREVSKVSSAHVLPLLTSSEWIIRMEAAQAATNLPTSVLGDYLIELLADPQYGIRKKAYEIFSSRIKTVIEYGAGWPAERLHRAQQNLKNLWKSEKQAVADKEVPALIEQLQSDDMGSRKYAIQNLKLLFNEDFGYKAEDSKANRKQAAEKWKQWWNRSSK